MKILAIETSCDETAVAIIEKTGAKKFRVLANLVSSQVKLHEKFGGVVPNLARREHEKNLVPILVKALKVSGITYQVSRVKNLEIEKEIGIILSREKVLRDLFIKNLFPVIVPRLDAIAVTYGPGLAPALWTGVNFAKALSALWRLPLIPINHMEGHIFSALIEPGRKRNSSHYSSRWQSHRGSTTKSGLATIHYPTIALLVSGGHTELHLIKKLGSYKRLGETLDDAAGEAFDKVAIMLGLPYPGGPEISKQAAIGNPHAVAFPRPMLKSGNFDFSFSGLKTSVLYYLRDHPKYSLADVAASFEQAAIDVLVEKTLRAAKKYKAQTILIGGGVAANNKLRTVLGKRIKHDLPGTTFLTPNLSQTGDNALMIALAAVYGEHSRTTFSPKQKTPKHFGAEPGLRL